MIESLSITKVATYAEAAEVMSGLKSLNFVFGSNGAGKTTIGMLIADPHSFPGCSISWKGGTPLQTLVYNRDFVERNFRSSETLKGVFTLGEKQVGTLEKIAELKSEQDALTKKIEGWNEALQGKDGTGGKRMEMTNLDSNFKDRCWVQKVKYDAKFQKAFEGRRNSSEKFKDGVLDHVNNTSELRPLEELTKRAETVFGKVPIAEPHVLTVNAERLLAHETAPILQKKVIGKSDVDIAAMIKKLGNSDWVKEGKAYFDQNGDVCPFCQQATEESFSKSLSEYFDETFLTDTRAVEDLAIDYRTETERLQQRLISIISSPNKFLDVEALKEEKELLDSKLTINNQRIDTKCREPSQSVELESIDNVVSAISSLISFANASVTEHNRMVQNLSSEKQVLTTQVWRFVVEEIKTDITTYQTARNNLEKAIKGLGEQIEQATRDRAVKVNEIRELERKTTSVQPTVDAINQLLVSFGFDGFSIANVAGTTSYKLIRSDGSEAMRTLSEGERTFVTFLYFFQLIKGSDTESGITNDRVVVFDDPVSSLDSDILFIVGSLIKGLFEEVREKKGRIKQVFVLTHNVYFHKEVTFNSNRRTNKAMGDESFWVVRKSDHVSKLEQHQTNPIKTSYELLWAELRRPDRSNLTIQNTLRRILENYFKILGGVDPDSICSKFEGRERFICKSLFSWVNDGSHFAHDDIFVSDGASVDAYLKVFKSVFYTLKHDAHYRMMMREVEDDAITLPRGDADSLA
ncbi:AAA family ATPase [Burkholderia cepacia]|uniref:AAA family ATPase n=1 Tax=Burkholderia cepacia TaxID=292 RepID=UPI002ABE379E|nr:AAA family ATPase [Burkholderia cepacia]